LHSYTKDNGGIEPSNRIFREEFYSRDDMLADTVLAFNAELNLQFINIIIKDLINL
jgi:hypothetical protein